ncbi:unnamed protein product [Symbiodinium sp. CCMP2456]|nr:unnamed protein product [Symbiodinium sp. CCMP2456]
MVAAKVIESSPVVMQVGLAMFGIGVVLMIVVNCRMRCRSGAREGGVAPGNPTIRPIDFSNLPKRSMAATVTVIAATLMFLIGMILLAIFGRELFTSNPTWTSGGTVTALVGLAMVVIGWGLGAVVAHCSQGRGDPSAPPSSQYQASPPTYTGAPPAYAGGVQVPVVMAQVVGQGAGSQNEQTA